jgi:hypothetical protein
MKDACAERNQEPREKQRGAGKTLRTSTETVVGSEAINQKIMGRRMVMFRPYYLGLTPCDRAPFLGIERAQLGELVRGSARTMRSGAPPPGHVSAEKVFQGRWVPWGPEGPGRQDEPQRATLANEE